MKIEVLTMAEKATYLQKKEIADFLFVHLDEFGDQHSDIMKCLDYALDNSIMKGGLVINARNENQIIGSLIINHTGMSGYIPENILVYIAVHKNSRGKGLGRILMEKAINLTKGSIALHVEHDNPAKKLYENLGFTNKYLEMRLQK